jgi:hypothetical protein
LSHADYKFSEQFGVKRSPDDDWFDPLLPTDTALFVDPFLIYRESRGDWKGAHDKIIDFFNMGLELMMKSMTGNRFNRGSNHYQAAQRLFLFPEPYEFCLGFGDGNTHGAGTGETLRRALMDAAEDTIQLGIESLDHFEELALFRDQIGADRTSDVVCNVLKDEFIAYTQNVMEDHELDGQAEVIAIRNASWSREGTRWEDEYENLLRNPFSNEAILLVPARFLRKLPTIESEDFWEWAWIHEADNIKGDFNYDLGKGVRRSKEIARLAERNVAIVRAYIDFKENNPEPAYDLATDPNGEVSWYDAAQDIAGVLTILQTPSRKADFCKFIEALIDEFKSLVENSGQWKLLWVGDKPRREEHVQLLFHAVMYGFCKSHDIDISPESNAGSGPLDFKFSQSWSRKAAVEIKLARNARFWQGLRKQIIQYMKAEDVPCGYFLSVQFNKNDLKPERRAQVEEEAKRVSKSTGKSVKPKFVNALKKKSASKL